MLILNAVQRKATGKLKHQLKVEMDVYEDKYCYCHLPHLFYTANGAGSGCF